MPILESRCIQCHGGDQTKKGLDMKTYESLMAGSENGAVVAPGDAGNSLLVEQLLNGKMPKKGPKLTPDQVQVISDWVNAGAKNN
jgi:mono/diheme cytochrome c family protein